MKDPEIEQLVDEKVNTFWRAVEGGRHTRGQVTSLSTLPTTLPILSMLDRSHLGGEATEEVDGDPDFQPCRGESFHQSIQERSLNKG